MIVGIALKCSGLITLQGIFRDDIPEILDCTVEGLLSEIIPRFSILGQMIALHRAVTLLYLELIALRLRKSSNVPLGMIVELDNSSSTIHHSSWW